MSISFKFPLKPGEDRRCIKANPSVSRPSAVLWRRCRVQRSDMIQETWCIIQHIPLSHLLFFFTHSPINYSVCMTNMDYEDAAQWKPFTRHPAVICRRRWERDIGSAKRTLITDAGNRAMEGWKQFVLCSILVYKSSRSIYGSPTSNEHTALDEIRKPHSGIITRCWCQIPRLPRRLPPPPAAWRGSHLRSVSYLYWGENETCLFALWSTSWISLDEYQWLLTTRYPLRDSLRLSECMLGNVDQEGEDERRSESLKL